MHWRLRDRVLPCAGCAHILGIVNVTPDSFSDGGQHATTEAAVAHAHALVQAGAQLLDVGGESSRPGAAPVALDVELQRVVPIVAALARQTTVPISVDTTKAEVARQALAAGAHIINDITGLRGDPEMPAVARAFDAGVIVMHMQGTPATMQLDPRYDDVARAVVDFLKARLHALADAGIAADRVVLDPGIGFGKTTEHNLELLARLDELRSLGRPVCLGVSRKGFLGRRLGRAVHERLAASLAAAAHALVLGTAQVLRVHDVAATRDLVEVLHAIAEHRRLPRADSGECNLGGSTDPTL